MYVYIYISSSRPPPVSCTRTTPSYTKRNPSDALSIFVTCKEKKGAMTRI